MVIYNKDINLYDIFHTLPKYRHILRLGIFCGSDNMVTILGSYGFMHLGFQWIFRLPKRS
jgi:hypothetical protein